jgi:hypothetical protein
MPRDQNPNVGLNVPQAGFLQLPHKYRALVAGFGSGKTFAGCMGTCAHFIEHPRVNQGYFAPTYPHIRDIYYPTIDEVAHHFGMRTRIVESNKEVHLYRGKWYYGVVLCRSMERPSTIVGFKVGRSHVDEIDILPHDKARIAWQKIIARLRWDDKTGVKNGIDVTTTPEGFRFVYEQFVVACRKDPRVAALYGLVQASTYQNRANLPEGYIEALLLSYPEALIQAYLRGEFVNLTQGSVYPSYNRITCFTNERIQPHEHLHIGMDFNVGKMAAIIHVIRNGRPYALREIVDVLDTPAMIGAIKLLFPGRTITVYPDASGGNRKSQEASSTDLSLLRQAGFQVLNNPANPRVRDRVLCMNRAFEDGYFVNPDTCPRLTEGLEKQAYDKNGEPDKTSGFDHGNDAAGYFIAYRYPQLHNRIKRVKLGGT